MKSYSEPSALRSHPLEQTRPLVRARDVRPCGACCRSTGSCSRRSRRARFCCIGWSGRSPSWPSSSGRRGAAAWVRQALSNKRTLAIYSGAALLLTVNWWVYIWAVNAGFIVETSLGYFINPLVNVAFGVVFFRERLRRWQWAAIAIAAVWGRLPDHRLRPPALDLPGARVLVRVLRSAQEDRAAGGGRGPRPRDGVDVGARARDAAYWRMSGRDREFGSCGSNDRSAAGGLGGRHRAAAALVSPPPLGDCRCRRSASCSTSRRPSSSCSASSSTASRSTPAADRFPADLAGSRDLHGRRSAPTAGPRPLGARTDGRAQLTTPGTHSVKGAISTSSSSPEEAAIW